MKRIALVLLLAFYSTAFSGNLAVVGAGGAVDSPPFEFTILTLSADDTMRLPIYDGGIYNFTVDWGDASSGTVTSYDDADAQHIYEDDGASEYNISISGTIQGWKFDALGDCFSMKTITRWGCLKIGNGGDAFQNCKHMKITATDILNMTGIMDTNEWFQGCDSLSTVPSMNSWDMSHVTTIYAMFHSCEKFNQPIGSWNLASLTNSGYVFYNNQAFNQDITSWDMADVTNANWMFYDATAFNQAVGSWDTGSLASADFMFKGATSFNQSLAGWDITALAGTHGDGLLNGVTLSTANYSATLISWGAQDVQSGVTFDGGLSKYSAGDAATARAHLINTETGHSWTITDGGAE
jgi:hypothetical protein